jgi:hypothetical protein
VEDVLEARGTSDDRRYLVLWLGYPKEFNTWEPKELFDAGSLHLVAMADDRWPPVDALTEAQEPLPLAPTQTPQWAQELTPANIERYIGVTVSRHGGPVLRLVTKQKAGEKHKDAHLHE